MLWFTFAFAIAFLAAAVQGLNVTAHENDRKNNRGIGIGSPPASALTVFILWGVCFGLIALFINAAVRSGGSELKWKPYGSNIELTNIQQTSDIHGRTYFLGSGYIDSEPAFYYYENTGGTYKLKYTDADDSEVREITDGTPHLDIQRGYYSHDNKWYTIFGGDVDTEYYYYTFYVPKGSISNSFSLGPQGG